MSEGHEYLSKNIINFKFKILNTELMVKLWSNTSLLASELVYETVADAYLSFIDKTFFSI